MYMVQCEMYGKGCSGWQGLIPAMMGQAGLGGTELCPWEFPDSGCWML